MRELSISKEALLGARLIRYEACDSTNERAREYAKEFSSEAVFLADRQTAGRGRRGRSFLSEAGGIYISFLYFPRGGEVDISGITAKSAVILARAIEKVTGVRCDIKWVNDLYIKGKKIAGILTEGEFDENGKLAYYVVGMGINVYKNLDFCRKMPIATTLEDAVGCTVDINGLCSALIGAVLSDGCDGREALEEYRSRCITVGQRVLVKSEAEEYEAEALSVLDDYSLQIRLMTGEIRRVFSGEVIQLRRIEE